MKMGRSVIALAYPLYVSIRAIETSSMYDKKKLVTYWIVLSFIYLFEHILEKLLEWVPVWSYLRLIFICWLVIPQLNGAFYLYQNFIHPHLQFKLANAITQFYATCSEWFEKLKKDSFIKKETFLAVAENYLEDNVSESLEKLTGSKAESIDENLLQIENKTSSDIQVISKTVIPESAKLFKLPGTFSLQVVQTRWTCEICEVTVSSELTLQSHLRGKRHRAKAKLWCTFCKLRCSGEIDVIAHLKGKRHLEMLKKSFANAGAS
ncbi:hypothetical protein RND71_041534 [Anisodus tanguticus]|uniref:HVA22-like protein n=1 Tax=Anisodus tanguticus TaxID=243964 RepID=A0AAE1UR85_9SOLA|nr:hypothetical protein RND71_041534 [Anisodus tanguticus]